jgi:mRNA interferase MazF
MKRGDIYMAEFEPRSGSEQRGFRPCIVVLNQGFLDAHTWFSLVVIPLTSSVKNADRHTIVTIAGDHTGLEKTSFALCHQITTLDKRKLLRRLGQIDLPQLTALEAGLKFALQLT